MGFIKITFSVLGLIAIFCRLTLLYIVYNIYCIMATIITVEKRMKKGRHTDTYDLCSYTNHLKWHSLQTTWAVRGKPVQNCFNSSFSFLSSSAEFCNCLDKIEGNSVGNRNETARAVFLALMLRSGQLMDLFIFFNHRVRWTLHIREHIQGEPQI